MINIYTIRPRGFNIGNDIIYYALYNFLRFAAPCGFNVVSMPTTKRFETSPKAGISSLTVYEINQFGHGLIVGGGNLYENNMLEIDNIALKSLERPMMLFSLSRGQIYNKDCTLVDRTDVMSDDKIIAINKRADISLTRDVCTHDYLNKLGCDNTLGGCPTLFLDRMALRETPSSAAMRTDALISLRNPGLMSVPVRWQFEFHETITRLIEMLKNNGYHNVKLLCHDHRDIPFAASLQDVEYLYTEDIYTYLDYLKSTRLMVTFRLHSCIPCLSLGTPVINISYDQRASSLMQTIGMSQWDVSMPHTEVVSEVQARINSLGDLENIKQHNRANCWEHYHDVMLNACRKFFELAQA